MRKSEKEFLKKKLEAIIKDVVRTPVECGVKLRALQALDALVAAVKGGKLKEPPPPPPKPMGDLQFDMLKGLRGLTTPGSEARENFDKTVQRHAYIRRKAKKA